VGTSDEIIALLQSDDFFVKKVKAHCNANLLFIRGAAFLNVIGHKFSNPGETFTFSQKISD
jgi:hypothetical protein